MIKRSIHQRDITVLNMSGPNNSLHHKKQNSIEPKEEINRSILDN